MRKNIIAPLVLFVCYLLPYHVIAQSTDSAARLSVSAYADAYYAFYTDNVGIGNYQQFPTISPRSNSIGLNVFQLSTQYDGPKIRATAILHFGDIPSSAWSTRYNAIQEAHAGIKLCKSLWLDAGFFKTHFGTESLMPKDNITSSVSMLTYYEPYYESGLKLNFDPTKELEINLFLLNGYGIFEDNNNKKSLGLGVTYLLGDKGNIGYTNYLGDDSPVGDSLPHLRFANNAFVNYSFSDKFSIQVGGDVFFQQNADMATGTKNAMAWGALATAKIQASPKFAVYGRAETFSDPQGFLSGIYTSWQGVKTGYQSLGATGGLEYKPSANSYIRAEYRRIYMEQDENIFHYYDKNLDHRNDIMVDFGVYFDLLKVLQSKK